MSDFSLVNLGEITKPATVLIERSSDAVKGVLRPWQTRRVAGAESEVEAHRIRSLAQAEADAAKIQAESEIEITDLHRRAFRRSLEQEAQFQTNMESILGKAIPLLSEDSAPEGVEQDWFTNFYDKCRISSDDEMQSLWSRILAGQSNNPGSFSRRTVNLVADLDKRDAELFRDLCKFGWFIAGRIRPLVFDEQDYMYGQHGIDFNSIGHLESLGLVRFGGPTGFRMIHLPKSFPARYYCQETTLTLPDESENSLSQGNVMLTQAGLELAPISGASPIPTFFDYVCNKWAERKIVITREN